MPPKGSGLPAVQCKWIDDTILEDYLSKAVDSNTATKELGPYRDTLYLRFCNQFDLNEDNYDKEKRNNVKNQFVTYLRNKKSQSVNKSLIAKGRTTGSGTSQSVVPSKTPPGAHDVSKFWSSVFHRDRMTGRSLFERQNRQSMNDYVNAERMALGLDHTHHPSRLKARAKELWEALNADAQETWNKEAKTLEEQDMTETLRLSENQAILTDTLPMVLSQLIGPLKDGKHKIGNGRFHVLYGYRNDDDVVETGYIDISNVPASTDQPFANFCKDYKLDIARAWAACCTTTIKENKPEPTVVATSTTFTRNNRGCPILPALPPDINSLRVVLSDFIQEQWVHSHPNSPFPTKLRSHLAYPEMKLIDPLYEKSWSAIMALAEDFLSKQEASPDGSFQLFLNNPVQHPPTPTQSVSTSVGVALTAHSGSTALQDSTRVPQQALPTTSQTQNSSPDLPGPTVPSPLPDTESPAEVSNDNLSPAVGSSDIAAAPLGGTDGDAEPMAVQQPDVAQPSVVGLAPCGTGGNMDDPSQEGNGADMIPEPTKIQKSRKRKAQTELESSAPRAMRRSTRNQDSVSVPGHSRRVAVPSDTVRLRNGKAASDAKRWYYVEQTP